MAHEATKYMIEMNQKEYNEIQEEIDFFNGILMRGLKHHNRETEKEVLKCLESLKEQQKLPFQSMNYWRKRLAEFSTTSENETEIQKLKRELGQ